MYTDAETSPHTRTASVVRAQNHLTHSLKPTPLDFMHVYEVRPRKDHRGVNLISDVLPFGRLWYGDPNVSRAVTPREVTAPSLAKPMGQFVRRTLGLARPQLRSLPIRNGAFLV